MRNRDGQEVKRRMYLFRWNIISPVDEEPDTSTHYHLRPIQL